MLEGQLEANILKKEVEQTASVYQSSHSILLSYTPGTQIGRAHLYGAEYKTGTSYANSPLISVHNHNVQCVTLQHEKLF